MRTTINKGAVAALVLARGGSKGLPGKNVRLLGGAPLIAWAVAAGRCAQTVQRVICSTDDDAIASVATRAGAEVPFRRPMEFAQDVSTDLDVFGHALRWLAEHEGSVPELMVQLRPTTPFRQPEWIDDAVTRMLHDPSITCVRSVAPSPLTPYKMWQLEDDGQLSPLLSLPGVAEPYNMPRQKLPPVYWHTGQIDVIRSEVILNGSMTGENIHALIVDVETAIDIDTAIDFKFAELVFDVRMPTSMKRFIESG